MDVNWIPCTSNICERLFSKAKLTLGHLRCSMSPYHLEQLLFLRCNKDLWNLQTVAKAIEKKAVIVAAAVVAGAGAAGNA